MGAILRTWKQSKNIANSLRERPCAQGGFPERSAYHNHVKRMLRKKICFLELKDRKVCLLLQQQARPFRYETRRIPVARDTERAEPRFAA